MVDHAYLSRRALLLSPAAVLGCRAPKATGYPGYCFVASQNSRSVAIVDLTTFRSWPPVRLDAAPSAVLSHPLRPKVFVLAPQAGTIYEIDAASLAVSRRVRAGNDAVAMRLTAAGDALWVLYREPAALVEIPLGSLHPRRRIRLPAPPDDFDLSNDGRAAVVSRQGLFVLASLDRAAIERTLSTGPNPTSVCFQWDSRQVMITSRADRSITIFDTPSGNAVVRLPLPIEPRQYCFNSDGGQLFLTGDGMDAVVVVYPYQTQVAETILAGRAPSAMAVTGSYLLVTNPQTNTVTVLDVDTNFKLVAVVQVGQEPRGILITPDKQYALVLNEKSGDLAVIRLFSLTEAWSRRYKSAPLFTLIPVGEKPVAAAVVALT